MTPAVTSLLYSLTNDKGFSSAKVHHKGRYGLSSYAPNAGKDEWCIDSSAKLSHKELREIDHGQDDLSYSCGCSLFPEGSPLHSVVVVREGTSCQYPMETAYFAGVTALFEPVCFHCGDTDLADNAAIRDLKQQYAIVRPICVSCFDKGLEIATRNANHIAKKNK